jgi:hypothetical protein
MVPKLYTKRQLLLPYKKCKKRGVVQFMTAVENEELLKVADGLSLAFSSVSSEKPIEGEGGDEGKFSIKMSHLDIPS